MVGAQIPNTEPRSYGKMAARPETADVFDALSVLSWDEFQVFATYLGKGVDLPTLKSIEHDHRTTDTRILHSIQAWLDYDFEVSWEKIIFALRKVGKNADAERLQSQHCPDITSHDSLLSNSSKSSRHPTPVASTPLSEASQDQLDVCGASATQSSLVDTTRMVEVANEAAELSEKFADVLFNTKTQLNRKESEPMFLKDFYTYLTTLPVSLKHKHLKFLKEERLALKAAKDVDEIFYVIEPYLTYTDYSLLKSIISKFCSEELNRIMNSYILELEEFEKSTTVDKVQGTLCKRDVPNGFKPVEIHTRLSSTICTLHEVRQIRKANAAAAALEPYSDIQLDLHASFVTIVLAFPERALSLVDQAMTADFLMAHNIESVTVSGKPLQSYIEEVSMRYTCFISRDKMHCRCFRFPKLLMIHEL